MDIKTHLKFVLKTTAKHLKLLETINIHTIGDLIGYFPRTHIDQSETIKISEIRTDKINVFKVKVSNINEIKSKFGKSLLKGKVFDESGKIDVVWFNQSFLKSILYPGKSVYLSGKAKFEFGKTTLINPSVEEIKKEQLHTGRLVPIYHETEGLKSKWIREKIKPLVAKAKKLFDDHIPEYIKLKYDLMDLNEAIEQIHFPKDEFFLQKAKDRLAFDELFIIQLNALQKKYNDKIKKGRKHIIDKRIDEKIKSLPFELTNGQKKALKEILQDMEKQSPMSRLLQGDVGSGKTIIAGLAVMNTILNKMQAAIMAPTEILAKQHAKTLKELFKNEKFNIAELHGGVTKQEKEIIKKEIAENKIQLIIGTHALIQESVKFSNLGLAVIDEQHRFGVKQRKILKEHGSPHLLSLSATPIPRTLALTVFGDQDISIIEEMPKGRLPIITRVVPEKKRKEAYKWIEEKIKIGRQAFIICPLIEESDVLELKAVKSEYEKLKNEIFPDLEMAFLHGKMKSEEKNAIMNDFKENKTKILVSTSVIEVGIDIPNASIIIIEGADRFGLSQLHQFRGRVGRGNHQSYCFLFSESQSTQTLQRLRSMALYNSGFKLAEIDLEIRGPGSIYGIKQSGIPDLKIASYTDSIKIHQAREAATEVIENDPLLANYKKLSEKVECIKEYDLKD